MMTTSQPYKKSSRALQHRAFTLTEMLIAVTIIGILVTLAVPGYFSSQVSQNKERCRDQMLVIARAEEMYRMRNRVYTTTLSALDFAAALYELPTGSSSGSTTLKVKCPTDKVTRDYSYTVALFTDTDGSPGFTVTEACGLHTASKARQLTSGRNGLSSDSSGVTIAEIACQ